MSPTSDQLESGRGGASDDAQPPRWVPRRPLLEAFFARLPVDPGFDRSPLSRRSESRPADRVDPGRITSQFSVRPNPQRTARIETRRRGATATPPPSTARREAAIRSNLGRSGEATVRQRVARSGNRRAQAILDTILSARARSSLPGPTTPSPTTPPTTRPPEVPRRVFSREEALAQPRGGTPIPVAPVRTPDVAATPGSTGEIESILGGVRRSTGVEDALSRPTRPTVASATPPQQPTPRGPSPTGGGPTQPTTPPPPRETGPSNPPGSTGEEPQFRGDPQAEPVRYEAWARYAYAPWMRRQLRGAGLPEEEIAEEVRGLRGLR